MKTTVGTVSLRLVKN